jgi:hypothetical protein
MVVSVMVWHLRVIVLMVRTMFIELVVRSPFCNSTTAKSMNYSQYIVRYSFASDQN